VAQKNLHIIDINYFLLHLRQVYAYGDDGLSRRPIRHAELVSASIKAAIRGGETHLYSSISAPDGAWMDAETRSA
jgi:hypothetical protein